MTSSTNRPATSRVSPPAVRVIAIIDALAAASDPAWLSLKDIADGTNVSSPTALGILSELCQLSVAEFDPITKRYRLGHKPSEWVNSRQSSITDARAFTHQISAAFSTSASLSYVLNNRIIIDTISQPLGHRLNSPVIGRTGDSFPFAPPIGLLYVAWASLEDQTRWLAGSDASVLLPAVQRLAAHAQTSGYLVKTSRHAQQQQSVIDNLRGNATELDCDGLLASFDGYTQDESSPNVDVSFVAAPLYLSDHQRYPYIISVHFDQSFPRDQLQHVGSTLASHCTSASPAFSSSERSF